jgi:hypothetical protein
MGRRLSDLERLQECDPKSIPRIRTHLAKPHIRHGCPCRRDTVHQHLRPRQVQQLLPQVLYHHRIFKQPKPNRRQGNMYKLPLCLTSRSSTQNNVPHPGIRPQPACRRPTHAEIAVRRLCTHPQRQHHPGYNESLRCCCRVCATTKPSSSTAPSSTAVASQLPAERIYPRYLDIVALQLLPATGTTGTIPLPSANSTGSATGPSNTTAKHISAASIHSQNNGQNRGTFTCTFCRQAGQGICDCTIAQTYVTENRVRHENGKLVMPDRSQIARSRPGKLLKECVDRVQQVRTSVVFEIISPTAQEALDKQATSQVNIQMQIDGKAKDEIDTDIEAYKYTIFELHKKKQKFDGVELPTRSKGRAPAVSLPPKPTAPAQPVPAIIPKPAKPFVLTTFEAQKQPQEPNFRYAAPIEDRAISNTLFNRMLDTQITITAREILATAPEVQKSFKDTTTMRKVPTLANPAKAYVDTNT